ncbi:MAG: hypothetical protein V8Q79_06235 [Christensenellales bacterium]
MKQPCAVYRHDGGGAHAAVLLMQTALYRKSFIRLAIRQILLTAGLVILLLGINQENVPVRRAGASARASDGRCRAGGGIVAEPLRACADRAVCRNAGTDL